jgi:hypothetical protein
MRTLTCMTTDRPSPRADRAQTIRLSKTTNNGILNLSSIALSSALMKGTFFYFGNAKYIVPIIYFNSESTTRPGGFRDFWGKPNLRKCAPDQTVIFGPA